jgi:hypothetical protein
VFNSASVSFSSSLLLFLSSFPAFNSTSKRSLALLLIALSARY